VKIRPINQPESLAKMAYETLRKSILEGQLKSGEIYNEMAIAKDLQISRTPVREALLELTAQGLVSFLPRKGVVINHYSKLDVIEIFEVREAIELFVIEKLSRNFRSFDLTAINIIFKRQEAAAQNDKPQQFIQADRDYHIRFCELAGNRRLVNILNNIRDMIQLMGIQALTRTGRYNEVVAEHKEIIEKVSQGKVADAIQAMRYHLDQSREAVLDQSENEAGRNRQA